MSMAKLRSCNTVLTIARPIGPLLISSIPWFLLRLPFDGVCGSGSGGNVRPHIVSGTLRANIEL